MERSGRMCRPGVVVASEQADELLRFLLWRTFGLIALVVAGALTGWLLDGGLGAALRGGGAAASGHLTGEALARALGSALSAAWRWAPLAGVPAARSLALAIGLTMGLLGGMRTRARSKRRYVRMRVRTYRTDTASAEAIVAMLEALHKRMLRRWWRRLLHGQPSIALEVHYAHGTVWLALTLPAGSREMVEAALRTAYPNCRLDAESQPLSPPPTVLRLKKHGEFIKRAKVLDHFAHEREPAMNRLMTVMGAGGGEAFVQVAVTPRRCCSSTTPSVSTSVARRVYRASAGTTSRYATARWSRTASCAAGWRSSIVRCSSSISVSSPRSRSLRADRLGATRRGGREPSGRARHRRAPRRVRHLHPSGQSRRGQPVAVLAPWRVRLDRAGGHLAPALDRLLDGPLRAQRPAAWLPRRRRSCVPPTGRHAAGRARRRLDPFVDAPPEHRRSRNGRAGQVQLPRRDRRRGSAPRALRGDRARPEGGRRRGGR